jgi:Tol biopolymer transport system component
VDVTINGSGFDLGATATFPLNGVVDPRVHVNSTLFVKSTQLVANVTIAPDAPTVKYDVAVLTATGKKGIGSELFTVNVPPPADPAIAYGYQNGTGFNVTYGLGVMNADGSNQTDIAASSTAPHPAWSPDGHSIAYHATYYGISRVDVSAVTGVPKASATVTLPITHLAFDIAWSPDASNPQIAYSEDQSNIGAPAGLYLAPATPVSPYTETLVYLGAPGNRMIWIAWNPQATRIAFIQRSINAAVDSLFVVDVATKSATFVRSFIRGVAGLSWSRTAPDRLALAVPLPNSSTFQPSILDLTTNALTNVPSGLFAKWSPDDSRLVYIASANSGVGPIYAVTLSTGAQVKLTTDGMEPEWRRNP